MKLSDYDAVLFDMDGTLYHDTHPLPGAVELLTELGRRGQPFACLTNAGWRTPAQVLERVAGMGIALEAQQLHTAAQAVCDWIMARWPGGRVCCFTGNALETLLREAGATLVTEADEPCDVVAVAGHMHVEGTFDLQRSGIVISQLRKGLPMVVTCRDRVYPVPAGWAIGSGSLGALFAYAGNVPAERITHVGKPNPEFFQPLLARLGAAPSRCLLVGDNLESDIRGGQAVGMQTALVLSGVATAEQARVADPAPNAVFADLADLLARCG